MINVNAPANTISRVGPTIPDFGKLLGVGVVVIEAPGDNPGAPVGEGEGVSVALGVIVDDWLVTVTVAEL